MSPTRSLLLLSFAVSLAASRERRLDLSEEYDPMPWVGYQPRVGYQPYPGWNAEYPGYYNPSPSPYYNVPSGYYPAYTMRRAYVYPSYQSYQSYPYYGLSPYKAKKTV